MGDLLGLLTLNVKKGTNLAIRDPIARSSDPYVTFHVGGKHKVHTSIKEKTTDPEWNDTLNLPVHDPNHPLRLDVLDKDLFWDDTMGHAEIDLRPLIEAGNQSSKPDGTVVKIMPPNLQNHFTKESKIYWSEQKVNQYIVSRVMQDIVIYLQDVETGEIEIELIWSKNPSI